MATKIPEIIKLRYQKMKDLTDPIFAAKQLNRALYAGNYYPKMDDSDYALTDPHTFPVMRNYLARSNIANSGIRLDPTNEYHYETRDINQKYLDWEIGEIMATTLFYRINYSAYMNGKGYASTGWKYEKAIKIEDVDDEGNVIRTKVMRDIVNRADAKFVRFEDILVPNQNIPTLREQPYYIKLIQMNVGEMLDENEYLLEIGQKPYWNEKWLKDLKESGVEKKLLDYQMDFPDESNISKEDIAFRSANVAMICMHTKEGDVFYLPFSGNDFQEKIVNNDTNNKYWHGHYPDFDFTPFPEDDNYFPLSVVDTFADLQIASSELLNLGLTNIRQGTFQMWVAGTPAAQTPDWMFRTRADGVIRVVGDPNQIQPIRVMDNSRSTMNMAQEVATRIEKATGISSLYSSGVHTSKAINQTARGAQIIDQNIDTNMTMIMDLFGEQVIKVLAEDFLELNAQYVTEEQTFMITGKRGVSELVHITPDQISANFKVRVNPERLTKQSPASRQASIQNSITILQNIQNQSQGAVQIDIAPLVEALIDSTPDMQNITDIVVSVDEKSKRDILMLERGQMPEIKVRDAHLELIQLADMHFTENAQTYTPEIQQLFESYVEKHMAFLQSQQEIQMMSQPQMPQAPRAEEMMGDMGNAEEVVGENDGTYNLGKIV
jgi:hypothetical protein